MALYLINESVPTIRYIYQTAFVKSHLPILHSINHAVLLIPANHLFCFISLWHLGHFIYPINVFSAQE